MDENSLLRQEVEELKKRVKYLEDTFATLADMNKSNEMGQYIAQRQRALVASKLVNAVASGQKLNADAQQQVLDQLAAEKAAMDARIEEAIRASEQNAPAEDDLAEQFTYREVPGGVEIQGFNGFEVDELVIPDRIKGQPVIQIGEEAFKNMGIKKANVSNSVIYIEKSAFEGCKKLATIKLPDRLKSLGQECFKGAGLTEISLPENVTNLNLGCFQDCVRLKTVILSEKLETIGSFAFAQTMIPEIVIPKSVKTICSYAFDWINGSIKIAILGQSTKIEVGKHGSPTKKIIFCLAGSEAQRNARALGLTVKPLNEFRNV